MTRRKRRTRDERKTDEGRWNPGLLHLAGAALLLSLIVALALRSHTGQRLGLPGAYVWVTALLIAFFLRLLHLARFLLPPEAEHQGARGWQEGLRMLLYHFFVLTLPRNFRDNMQRGGGGGAPQLPDSFSQFQAGFVDSHLALALGKGTGFSRAAGPGYVRLNKGEHISDVIDLRRQVRRHGIEALTRDGIALQTSLSLIFRVDRPERDVEPSIPYPHDGSSIFRLTYADGVGDDSEIPWDDRVVNHAVSLLVAEIARYRLDQLYQPDVTEIADAVSVHELAAEVQRRLDEQLLRLFDCSRAEECPLEILSVSVGQMQPPTDVVQQRIRNWQNAWERRQAIAEAESRADGIKTIQQIRSRALAELIETVTENVEQMVDSDRERLSEIVMLRMTQMVDRLLQDPQVQSQAPDDIFDTVSEARTWLKELPATNRE